MDTQHSTRRQFLAATAAGMATMTLMRRCTAAEKKGKYFSFGLVTDVHYADIPANGIRRYRDSVTKLREAVATFNHEKVAFVAELGDFCDAGASKKDDIKYLREIGNIYSEFKGPRHYVLGNHCVTKLTKAEFLANCGTTIKKSHYSFDAGPYHFVVLDANFKPDETSYKPGNFFWTKSWIPVWQQKWLAEDLEKAGRKKSIVFIHQNLHNEKESTGVKNAPEVRRVLESAGNVLAVFQGHKHEGDYAKIGGIHYCTLQAMVEGASPTNNAYAIVTLDGDRISLEPFGNQKPCTFR
ncbi:MAG: metallophosphoesterase [Pirellulales bacterium]|nr:metallophosphoesterase [Pirellulales bacterium]